MLCVAIAPARAADRAAISGLGDVAFGTITSFAADSVQAQNICVYSKSPPLNQYQVTASGSGNSGAFALSSGTATLPYEVQWSDAAGQTTGTSLTANQPLSAQQETASNDSCSAGPATTASLIVILRSSALATAASGSYSGTLSLLIAPQ